MAGPRGNGVEQSARTVSSSTASRKRALTGPLAQSEGAQRRLHGWQTVQRPNRSGHLRSSVAEALEVSSTSSWGVSREA